MRAEYYLYFVLMFVFYIILISCSLLIYIINRKNLPANLWYLALLLFITIPKELYTHWLYNQGKRTYLYNHLFQNVEFILMSMLYYTSYYTQVNKKTVRWLSALYIPGSIAILVFREMNRSVHYSINYNLLTGVLLMVVYAMLYIYELFRHPLHEQLLKMPFFWINTGVLFYYSGIFFQVGLHGHLLQINKPLADQLNLINHLLNYFLYLCFMIGFLCKHQTKY